MKTKIMTDFQICISVPLRYVIMITTNSNKIKQCKENNLFDYLVLIISSRHKLLKESAEVPNGGPL